MNVLAIDPGPLKSQYLRWCGDRLIGHAHQSNDVVLAELNYLATPETKVCIEMVASYGMAVGREVFETCVWIGRFQERCYALGVHAELVFRQEVKLHLCNSARAKDGNIRQALIDRFGGKEKAIGRKASPGPLYGVSSHAWAALALAITFADRSPASTVTQTAKTA